MFAKEEAQALGTAQYFTLEHDFLRREVGALPSLDFASGPGAQAVVSILATRSAYHSAIWDIPVSEVTEAAIGPQALPGMGASGVLLGMAPPSDVQPSEELEHVTRRIVQALADDDADALANLVSEDPCLIMVGTDEEEYWEGRHVFFEIAKRQRQEMSLGDVGYSVDAVRAFRDGPFGWSVSRASFLLPDGRSAKTRTTYVFHLVAGQWRLVHAHVSIGNSNLETIGIELTTSLDSLAEFAESSRPDLTDSTASDGTVTIVFTDIEASTEIAERLGDRRWVELLHWHEDIIESEATRNGGSVVKSQGDGFMLAFSAASRALDFAAAVQSRTAIGNQGQPVRVRIGINTGDAVRDREDFFGHAVTVAARVAAHALGGEVLATDLVVGLVAGADQFSFGDAQTAQLKGLSGSYIVRPLLIDA